jgi:hypothetical protein
MAKSDQPFVEFSDMMTQNFEQTRKAMQKYADVFEKGMKASPWLDADLNKKIKDYMEKNIAAANEFMRKLSEAKDVQSFWLIQTNFMQTQWKTLCDRSRLDVGWAIRALGLGTKVWKFAKILREHLRPPIGYAAAAISRHHCAKMFHQ